MCKFWIVATKKGTFLHPYTYLKTKRKNQLFHYAPKISHFSNKIKNTHFIRSFSQPRIFANRMTAFLFGCRPDAVTGFIFGAGFDFFFLRFNAVSKSDSEVW